MTRRSQLKAPLPRRGRGGTQPARAGWVRASAQLLACDRDAVQEAAFAVVVVDREVPGRALAQKAEGPFPPLEAAGEFGPHRVAVEIIEQRARLLLGPALEAHGEPRIDVKRLAAGVGVTDDHRMHGVLRRELGVANAALEIAPPRRRTRAGSNAMPGALRGSISDRRTARHR